MFQRDYMLNEARKFALMLARLLGLKADGKLEEFNQEFDEVLRQDYNADAEKLMTLNTEELIEYIKQGNFSTEKLNALAGLLFMYAEPFTPNNETVEILNKVITIFDLLQEEHHYESFENLDKRNTIYRFFKTNYGSTKVDSTPL